MFDAYKRFFRFAGEQKGTWYKGMAFELLRSIFEALQFVALLVVLRALVEQNMTGATPWMAFGIMAVSVAGAALCWYLAHNSEGHANYRMCAEKRIHTPAALAGSRRGRPWVSDHAWDVLVSSKNPPKKQGTGKQQMRCLSIPL